MCLSEALAELPEGECLRVIGALARCTTDAAAELREVLHAAWDWAQC